MELELTKRNLRRLAEQESPAVEDVLNFIYDFCHDIKTDTGIPVEKLACRDENALYRRLPWMGRQIMRIGKQKEDLFSETSRQDRIREIGTELDALSSELESAGADLSAVVREKSLQAEKLRTLREQAVSERMAMEQEQTAAMAAIQKEERAAQEELRLKNDALRAQIEEEKKQTEELRREYEALSGERELELREARKELAEREEKKAELQALLEGRTAELVRLDAGRTAEEIQILQKRADMLLKLQEKLRSEWSSTWGQEQAEQLTDKNMGELLKNNLREMSQRLTRCGKSLRETAEALSETEQPL